MNWNHDLSQAPRGKMVPKLIPIAEHESNLDPTCKLEWPQGQVLRGSVYSCRKGFVALLDGMAFEGHFETLADAKAAAQGKVD